MTVYISGSYPGPGTSPYVPIIPAILLSGTKEVLFPLSPASHPASFYFRFLFMLIVSLHSSSYLEEDNVPGIQKAVSSFQKSSNFFFSSIVRG